MRTCYCILLSLVTVGCIVAQEPNVRQNIEPRKLDFTFPTVRPLPQQPNGNQNNELGKLDFTFLRRPVPEKRFLDFKFPALRPLPGKLDFTVRPQRNPVPQERLFKPQRNSRLLKNP